MAQLRSLAELRAAFEPEAAALAVTEILRGRVHHHMTTPLPADAALERHMALARAIQKREPDAARASARQIVDQSILESRHLWGDLA
jgi:DNA-binding FadR family transcriptional regulator